MPHRCRGTTAAPDGAAPDGAAFVARTEAPDTTAGSIGPISKTAAQLRSCRAGWEMRSVIGGGRRESTRRD